MDSTGEIAIGICGIGGFARSIARHVLESGNTGQPQLRLAAACDPNPQANPDQVAKLREAGVDIYEDFEQLLARQDILGVWLPLPIDLHRPFTERALAAGKHVMCEKPAAGCIDDVDAMIAARDRYHTSALIGFQDIYDPTTVQAKRLLLDGVIGEVTHATLNACWPRGSNYFNRSSWAGRIQRNGTWVLDSPANNAMAHFVNLGLALLGPTLHTSATPVAIDAELYRAAPIENYDTISARATLESGVTFLVLLTHACETETGPVIRVHGSRGIMERSPSRYRIVNDEGERVIERATPDRLYTYMYECMLPKWGRVINGTTGEDDLVATLEIARNHALFVSGASEATPVQSIEPPHRHTVERPAGETIQAIPGIEALIDECAEQNQMLHESGRLQFTQPSGRFDLKGYNRFTGGQTPTLTAASEG